MSDLAEHLTVEINKLKASIQSFEQLVAKKKAILMNLENKLAVENKPVMIEGCGKFIYPDEKAAKVAMVTINATMNDLNKKIERKYFCDICNGWHLTSKKWKGNYNQGRSFLKNKNQ